MNFSLIVDELMSGKQNHFQIFYLPEKFPLLTYDFKKIWLKEPINGSLNGGKHTNSLILSSDLITYLSMKTYIFLVYTRL